MTIQGTVTRVIDGDTIWVKAANGSKPLKVRLQAIDAPEVCQAGGVAAKNALTALVLGKGVTLTTRTTDNYNRTVANVQLQGQDVGRSLVRSGHAWATGPFKSAGPYAAEQRTAQAQQRGIFASGNPQHPRDFRKRNGSCFKQR